jgi:hypothetical protein
MGPMCNPSHVYAVIKFMPHFLQRIFVNLGDSDVIRPRNSCKVQLRGGTNTKSFTQPHREKILNTLSLFHYNREYKTTFPQATPFCILYDSSAVCYVNAICMAANTSLTFILSFGNTFCYRNHFD